jgi:alpha-L-fucosidase
MHYEATRESVDMHEVPAWYHDAKFGIFIHWSLSAVPAFAPRGNILDVLRKHGAKAMLKNQPYTEWYLNSLRIKGSPVYKHHRETYGEDFDYYRFAEDFNRELPKWDPAVWADLFERVGARYVVFVSKHHDGFLLWPSENPNPMRPDLHASRDVCGELSDAVKARGMRMGFYYSSPYDWTFTKEPITDLADAAVRVPSSRTYVDYANGHWHELIDRYDPSVLWSDIGYPPGTNVNEIFSYFYNKTPDGVVDDRWDQSPGWLMHAVRVPGVRRIINSMGRRMWLSGKTSAGSVHHDYRTPEYATYAEVQQDKWECVRGIGTSFGYNAQELPGDYISVPDLVRLLVDIVSKNGNLLLNVGPKPGGEIPAIQVERLAGLGEWLAKNGDAIYGTRPCDKPESVTTDGIDVRFTRKDRSLYAVLLGTPSERTFTIKSLEKRPRTKVEILGRSGDAACEQTPEGLKITLGKKLADSPAHSVKMTPAPAINP